MTVLADISTPFSNLTIQVYSPESAESSESEVSWLLDDIYSVSDFISGLVGDVTIVPSGPFHTIIMDSGRVEYSPLSSSPQYRSKLGDVREIYG